MSGKRHHKKNNSLGNARIEKYYTKIVAGFIGVTILLVLLIVYFSFSKNASSFIVVLTPRFLQ